MPNVSKPVSNVNYAVLNAPGGLALSLEKELIDGALAQDDFSEVVDTLQVLLEQLHGYHSDLSDLRSTLFALTVVVEGGRKTESKELLQKIAGVLEAIPEPVFRSAADHVIQSRAWKFSPPPNVTAMVAKALAGRSKIIHQEVVPTILRLTAQAASIDQTQSFKARQSLDRIKIALEDAFDKAVLPEEKKSVLQQYSTFVILTSGLIPKRAPVDLSRLPMVVLGTPPELAIAVSGPDFILLSNRAIVDLSKEDAFHVVRHETIHVLQKLEALRDPEVGWEFREFAGETLAGLVASQGWEYTPGSRAQKRSRWFRDLFDSYKNAASEWMNAVFAFRKMMKPLKQFVEVGECAARLDLAMTGAHTLAKETDAFEQNLEGLIRKVEQDGVLTKPAVNQVRALAQRAIQATRAFVDYPIEAMAETPFDYGRAGEVLDKFFERRKRDE